MVKARSPGFRVAVEGDATREIKVWTSASAMASEKRDLYPMARMHAWRASRVTVRV